MYRKTQVQLRHYTPKKNVQHQELHKTDNNLKVDNNQTVINNQRPKHTIKAPNRLGL